MSYNGSIKKFMEGKGFGFIERDDGEEDVFVHFSALTNGGSEDMVIGEKVTFDLGTDDRTGKTRAQNVTLVNGGSGAGGGGKGKGDKGKGKGKGGKDDDRYNPY